MNKWLLQVSPFNELFKKTHEYETHDKFKQNTPEEDRECVSSLVLLTGEQILGIICLPVNHWVKIDSVALQLPVLVISMVCSYFGLILSSMEKLNPTRHTGIKIRYTYLKIINSLYCSAGCSVKYFWAVCFWNGKEFTVMRTSRVSRQSLYMNHLPTNMGK